MLDKELSPGLQEYLPIVEAILLAAPEPLSGERLGAILEVPTEQAAELLEYLRWQYDAQGRGFTVRRLAGGYRLQTRGEYAAYVSRLAQMRNPLLTTAALETLAILAYMQPCLRADIEKIRGVKTESTLRTLLERGLVEEVGRAEGPGRPILYGTTRRFLEYFGLADLRDLPAPPAEWQAYLAQKEAAPAAEQDD
ncbi:MAG TPA: SMC-Scp complex subunit ScpB [Firmicutes bacterium]|jgi:segregation and condensation protein B|nr:SMC-Scp complex subunit ScpB [Bacillota bacterium]